MTDYINPKGINRRSWAEVQRLSKQKFPEIVVEPKKTVKDKGSSDSTLMQQMFPGSPIYDGELNNQIVDEQKETLLAKGIVDDKGHTFGKVDRSFKASPGSIELDFDISSLLDITPYWHITGSLRREAGLKRFVSKQGKLESLTKISEVFAEYEEGVVYLNNQTVGTITFTKTFSVAPYVVLTPDETPDNQSNINVFGLTLPTKTGLLFGTSAPFTGYIRYRAAAEPSYTWPRSAASVFTSSMKIYAGEQTLVNVNEFTTNFNFATTVSPSSIIYLSTMYDAYFNRTANTGIQLNTINSLSPINWNANSDLSDYVTAKIHFIAFKI